MYMCIHVHKAVQAHTCMCASNRVIMRQACGCEFGLIIHVLHIHSFPSLSLSLSIEYPGSERVHKAHIQYTSYLKMHLYYHCSNPPHTHTHSQVPPTYDQHQIIQYIPPLITIHVHILYQSGHTHCDHWHVLHVPRCHEPGCLRSHTPHHHPHHRHRPLFVYTQFRACSTKSIFISLRNAILKGRTHCISMATWSVRWVMNYVAWYS